MLESHHLKQKLTSLVLLALTLFLALSVLTFHPADPPATSVYPTNGEIQNVCGFVGAYTAHILFESMGYATYMLLIMFIAWCIINLSAYPIEDPFLRTSGVIITIMASSSLCSLLASEFTTNTLMGPGGALGLMLTYSVNQHFAFGGSLLFLTSVLIAGLLLCTDSLILKATVKGIRVTAKTLVKVVQNSSSLLQERLLTETKSTKGEQTDDQALDPEMVSVRIGGRTKRQKKSDIVTDDPIVVDVGRVPVEELPPVETEVKQAAIAKAEETESEDEPAKRELKVNTPTTKSERAKTERDAVMKELEAASREESEDFDYELPSINLLTESEDVSYEEHEQDVLKKAKILEKTFMNFGFNVRVVEIDTGPVIAQFEVELEAGLRLSKITGLADDLAIALRVPSVRIVAPIPGKNTVGIEVPNAERQLVRMREVIQESVKQNSNMQLPIFLGKDVSGNPLSFDLAKMPHLLIAGRTGTGKSVCLNSIIASLLMTRRPDEVKMLLIDPKMVELSCYKRIPHLMHPVVTDMKKAEAILAWAVEKMEERYKLLCRAGVRHISAYNQLGEAELKRRMCNEDEDHLDADIPTQLPFIVIVADEMADLMMTAAKEVETHIIRLAQKSRAVGIHLVLATQKPTVDVITGLIKSNLPARICFQVASRTDSRVVLDEMGADKLLGNGDMLFLSPGTSVLLRGQGTYISDEEIDLVVNQVGTSNPQYATELVTLQTGEEEKATEVNTSRDDLYEQAIEVVLREGRGSVSLLQRALGIGYGRAARIVDYMAEDGIVGEYNGSKSRDVLITLEQWEQMQHPAEKASADLASESPPKKRNVLNLREPEISNPLEEDQDEGLVDEFEYDDEEELEYAED